MARARLIKRGSRAKLSGASRARSHVRALVRSRGRRRRETRRRRGTRAARSEAVCDVVGASRARVRFPATTPGRPDDERAIQAAASRVVDITPWVLPLLLTVIVYVKQPSPSLPPPPPLSRPPSHLPRSSRRSLPLVFVSFLSRVLFPRPCLAPVSFHGFRAIRLSRVVCNLHSFLSPATLPVRKGCLLSSLAVYTFSRRISPGSPIRARYISRCPLSIRLSLPVIPTTGSTFPSLRHDSVSVSSIFPLSQCPERLNTNAFIAPVPQPTFAG